MLGRLRSYVRTLAAVVLWPVALLGAGSVVPHGPGCHEAECAALALAHDAEPHGIRGAVPDGSSHTLHCLVCAPGRTLRPPASVVQQLESGASDTRRAPLDSVHVPLVFPAAQPPLRSPPSVRTA